MNFFVVIILLLLLKKRRDSTKNMGHDYVSSIIGEQSSVEFALWAFGEGYENARIENIADRWNSLHREKLFLKKSGDIKEDTDKMIKIWKQRQLE